MAKKAHNCSLRPRQVKVTNLNYQPEKKGKDELVPRVDLSLEMVVDDMDLAELVRVRSGANLVKVLWDKGGNTNLLDPRPILFDIEFAGTASLKFVNGGEAYSFESARLKKLHVAPQNGRQAEVTFQLRVDPGEHLDFLGDLRIAQRAMFGFSGAGDDATDAGKQEKLT